MFYIWGIDWLFQIENSISKSGKESKYLDLLMSKNVWCKIDASALIDESVKSINSSN